MARQGERNTETIQSQTFYAPKEPLLKCARIADVTRINVRD